MIEPFCYTQQRLCYLSQETHTHTQRFYVVHFRKRKRNCFYSHSDYITLKTKTRAGRNIIIIIRTLLFYFTFSFTILLRRFFFVHYFITENVISLPTAVTT